MKAIFLPVLNHLKAGLRVLHEACEPAAELLDQPALPAQVVDYFIAYLERSPPPHRALHHRYLRALADFCTGQAGRPACTVANVLTLARLPNYGALLEELANQEILYAQDSPLFSQQPYSNPQFWGEGFLRWLGGSNALLTYGHPASILTFLVQCACMNGRDMFETPEERTQRNLASLEAWMLPTLAGFIPTKRAKKQISGLRLAY